MKIYLNWFLVLGFLILTLNGVWAQEKCATVPYNQQLQNKVTGINRSEIFEKWIRQKKFERDQRSELFAPQEEPVYIIPVVVHVIYYEDSEGTPVGNISEEQIFSQIHVLNEDYRRMNYDTIYTPENFLPVAADTRIEFHLAQRDPFGAPTTGILRLKGPQTSWNPNSVSDDALLKSLSFWPPEDYLNIWITNLSSDFLGYGQYPITDLPGSLPPFDRETDGVVIDYQVFGSIDKGTFPNIRPNYDQGRTTTHEVGHFLGLRHIWGDSDQCGVTDYCDDTPDQETSYSSCTNILGFSCGSEDMYQNYMDYTYDACMNIFTADQMERMRIVLENSPRRASLLTSSGLVPPDTVSNILIVREILNPANISCESVFNPEISLQNIGNNPISSFEVELTLDEVNYPAERFDIGIQTGGTLELSLADMVGADELTKGQHKMGVLVKNVNEVDTINYPRKYLSKYFVSSDREEFVPYRESFNDMDIQSSLWTVFNPDNNITWKLGSVPVNNKNNQAASIKMYDYNIPGQEDWLISPVLDFSQAPDANFTFDYSYARYDSIRQDLLEIVVSVDCGESFPFTVYAASSDQLSVRDYKNSWTPLVSADWKHEFVDLSDFAGMEEVRIAFRTTNGFGNNLYLDNIEFHVTGFSETIVLDENSMLIHPNPSLDGTFYVTINTKERQPVDIRVINVLGKQILEKRIELALNQTTLFDLVGFQNGIYLIHAEGRSFRKSARVIVDK
jgi:hypothetical protein